MVLADTFAPILAVLAVRVRGHVEISERTVDLARPHALFDVLVPPGSGGELPQKEQDYEHRLFSLDDRAFRRLGEFANDPVDRPHVVADEASSQNPVFVPAGPLVP